MAMPLHELRSQARSQGRNLRVAELMTLCGVKHAELAPELQKFKGRIVYATTMAFRMSEYAEQIVQTYCELTGTRPDKLRRVTTPSIAESAITDEEISTPGELHDSASRILMRCLSLISFAVTRLASRVTRWTAWEDRQRLRLVSYGTHRQS